MVGATQHIINAEVKRLLKAKKLFEGLLKLVRSDESETSPQRSSSFLLKDIVPQEEISSWKENVRKKEPVFECPAEVESFITALSLKLGDFGQIRREPSMISGRDLLLCNLKEHNGQSVSPWDMYPLHVPYMVAVDHYTAMKRIYRKSGKEGLIGWCKVKVKGTELERLLKVLNVHVFHQESEDFQQVMHAINESKKQDIVFEQ